MPVPLYRLECWSVRKAEECKILTAEMNWLRGVLRVSRLWKMNNEIRKQVKQEKVLLWKSEER